MNYIVLPLLLFILSSNLYADEIGSVDTVFKFLGSNYKIVIETWWPQGIRSDVLFEPSQDS